MALSINECKKIIARHKLQDYSQKATIEAIKQILFENNICSPDNFHKLFLNIRQNLIQKEAEKMRESLDYLHSLREKSQYSKATMEEIYRNHLTPSLLSDFTKMLTD